MDNCRIDKWLWATRIYKTRSQATAACRGGKVQIKGINVKPAREVKLEEVVTIRKDGILRTVKVIRALEKRVSAKLVPDHLEDLTPDEEYETARERKRGQGFQQAQGAGRPTKRRRRMLDKFFGKVKD